MCGFTHNLPCDRSSVFDYKSLKSRHCVSLRYIYVLAHIRGRPEMLSWEMDTHHDRTLWLSSPHGFLFLLEITCLGDETMIFYNDEVQKWVRPANIQVSSFRVFQTLRDEARGHLDEKSPKKILDPQERGWMTQQEGSILSQPGLSVTPEWALGSRSQNRIKIWNQAFAHKVA